MHVMQTKKQPIIVLIEEPWIRRNVIQGLDENKLNLFYKKGNNQKPRTCIVTSKELTATLMPQYSSGDITTIIIRIRNSNDIEEIILSSLYMPYEEQIKIPDDTAREAIEFSASSGIPIIIGADCNAHHILWGSSNTNKRGEKLVEYLTTTDLDIQNKGIEATFVNKLRQEVLDITLATQSISNRINNWHVSSQETLSDHREINFTINCELKTGKLYRNPRNIDWSIFNRMLMSKTNKLSVAQPKNTNDIDKTVRTLTKSLHDSFVCACPGRISAPKRNHWWNKAGTTQKRVKKALSRSKSQQRRLKRARLLASFTEV